MKTPESKIKTAEEVAVGITGIVASLLNIDPDKDTWHKSNLNAVHEELAQALTAFAERYADEVSSKRVQESINNSLDKTTKFAKALMANAHAKGHAEGRVEALHENALKCLSHHRASYCPACERGWNNALEQAAKVALNYSPTKPRSDGYFIAEKIRALIPSKGDAIKGERGQKLKKARRTKAVWRHWCGAKFVPNRELGNCPNYYLNGVHK